MRPARERIMVCNGGFFNRGELRDVPDIPYEKSVKQFYPERIKVYEV
jgi:hypothetical protein